jgi:hypothetical protein
MLLRKVVERLAQRRGLQLRFSYEAGPCVPTPSSSFRTIYRRPRCGTPIGSVPSSIAKSPIVTIDVSPASCPPPCSADRHHREHRLSYIARHRRRSLRGTHRQPMGAGAQPLRRSLALGNKACCDGFSALYKRASRLFTVSGAPASHSRDRLGSSNLACESAK